MKVDYFGNKSYKIHLLNPAAAPNRVHTFFSSAHETVYKFDLCSITGEFSTNSKVYETSDYSAIQFLKIN